MTYEQRVLNMAYDKQQEKKILDKIKGITDDETFIDVIRDFDECFASCNTCAIDLEDGDDGYMTSYGTCGTCDMTEEEALKW